MSEMRSKRQDSELHDASAETESVDAVANEKTGARVDELEVLDEVADDSEDSIEMTEAERLELRVRGDLEGHGIVAGEAVRLAEVLTERLLEHGPEGYEDLVAGALWG
jgi:hypothetical protein